MASTACSRRPRAWETQQCAKNLHLNWWPLKFPKLFEVAFSLVNKKPKDASALVTAQP